MFLLDLTRQQIVKDSMPEPVGRPTDSPDTNSPGTPSPVTMLDVDTHRKRIAAKILHFRTHLPLYSLEVAAGSPGKQIAEIEPEHWVEVKPGPVRLTLTCL